MISRILGASAIVGALLFAVPASAATFTYDLTLDPASLTQGGLNSIALPDPALIGVGDIVDLTLRFTGGATVTIADNSYLWTGLLTSTEGQVTTTGTLSFENGGNVGTTTSTQDNQYVHAGNFFFDGDYRTAPGSVSFSAIRQVFSIDANIPYTDSNGVDQPAGPDPREYNSAFFSFNGTLTASAVPEPASWAMFIGGLGLAGGVLRRRAGKVSYAVA